MRLLDSERLNIKGIYFLRDTFAKCICIVVKKKAISPFLDLSCYCAPRSASSLSTNDFAFTFVYKASDCALKPKSSVSSVSAQIHWMCVLISN